MSFGTFGTSAFGSTPATTASAFGTAGTTGSAFGTAGTTGSAFGTATGGAFGSSAPTGFSGFGATSTASPFQSTGFGTSFGGAATTTTSAPSLFSGFNQPKTTATNTFGTTTFGAAAAAPAAGFGGTSTGFSGFGANPTGFQSTGFGATGFGTTTTTSSLFSGFGQTQTQTQTSAFTGLGGFGTNKPFGTTQSTFNFGSTLGGGTTGALGGTTLFGQQQQQQPQQQQQQLQQTAGYNELVVNSILNCHIFGDERDQVLAKWNLLQAFWGTGKGYYAQNTPPVEYTPQNPLCKFKAIGYSCKPSNTNKDSLIILQFNKTDEEIRNQENQLQSSLSALFGNKPNLSIILDSIKAISESKSSVIFYVEEKLQTGVPRRIPNSEIVSFMMQPVPKQQLTTMGVEDLFPFSPLDEEILKNYLANPPAGIDPRIWKQAQLENPDPEKFIPVPLVGVEAIRWRSKCQEQENKMHQAFLDRLAEDISELQAQYTRTAAKALEYKQSLLQLQHRLLKVLVKQEMTRNHGMALRPEEEALSSRLESLHHQLNMPSQFKGRLNELLAMMRLQFDEATSAGATGRYSMDPSMQSDIKQFLQMEQNGMTQLIDVINNDKEDLKTMFNGIRELKSYQSGPS